jgi:hypothetical protein
VPAKLPVSVTADNRFILCERGSRGQRPLDGHGQELALRPADLAPHLRKGENVIEATV